MYYPMPIPICPNRATLDIIGLYNYNSHLFDDMQVPASVSRDDVVHEILETCAELEVLYPDWDFMKSAIDHWSSVEMATWSRVEALTQADYNPIENYDRYESGVDTSDRKRDNVNSRVRNASGSGTEKAITSSSTNTDTVDKVAGYNTNALGVNGAQTEISAGGSSGSNERKSQTAEAESGTLNENERENAVHQLRTHGNIGVTTVAEMMAGELDIYPRINLVNYIVNSFKNRFCLLVY